MLPGQHRTESIRGAFAATEKDFLGVMNRYEACPVLENEKFIIRLLQNEDCNDLLQVYRDKNALPFFHSDHCDGDNFYYGIKERMTEAIGFWNMAYENGWFARLSIVDKTVSTVIGTVELCLRVSEDEFHNMGKKFRFRQHDRICAPRAWLDALSGIGNRQIREIWKHPPAP